MAGSSSRTAVSSNIKPNQQNDTRVMKLAEEIADTSQRFVPQLLLKLATFLENAKPGSGEATRLKQEIWQYDLCPVILMALKEDYSNIQGAWLTAVKVAKLASEAFFHFPFSDSTSVDNANSRNYVKSCAENLLILARRLQDRYGKSLEPDNVVTEITSRELLQHYKSVLALLHDALRVDATSQIHGNLAKAILHSPWFLQLFVTDDVNTGFEILNFLYAMLQSERHLFAASGGDKTIEKLHLTVYDELVYAVSISNSVKICEIVLKIVVHICRVQPDVLSLWSRRYHGIKLVLMRWWNRGSREMQRALIEVMQYLEDCEGRQVGLGQDKFYRSAVIIQSMWRAFVVRKQLKKVNQAFGRFQTVYRKRKEVRDKKQEEEKIQRMLSYQVQSERRRHMRENQERELQLLETLPAPLVARHVENYRKSAATKIQATWRGSSLRRSLRETRPQFQRERAARIIQRCWQRYRHRCQLGQELEKQKAAQRALLAAGLTEERRHELIEAHRNWCSLNGAGRGKTREEQEQVFRHAQILIQKRVFHLRQMRRKDHERASHMACAETDASLLSSAPSLSECTEADVDRFTSRTSAVANYAKELHKKRLQRLQAPWWKSLLEEDQLMALDEDLDFHKDILRRNDNAEDEMAQMLRSMDPHNRPLLEPAMKNQDIIL